ncbi:hypothetical protein AB0A74_03225 [Saccharothrix sp. NPDC042600]|uniref:hypothetical protein n=1 Tax=Saccharothrix TaxID=2071 RepID=UPI0033F7426C|nr:hypothetical protein GCM10017745_67890 [Saccharothrix mutabilis subsp. capreolus]
MRRFQRLDIHARAGRNTTLMNLGSQLPAVVLSKLLGIGTTIATRWSDRAGAPRAAYAAEVARRT